MTIEQLLLKTAFACAACDGKIADEEVAAIELIANEEHIANPAIVKHDLNKMVRQINDMGGEFIKDFLNDVSNASLSTDDELRLVYIAFKIIEADEIIEYKEIKFFKLIRSLLKVSDAEILDKFPGKEDYLAQDTIEDIWSSHFELVDIPKFAEIS